MSRKKLNFEKSTFVSLGEKRFRNKLKRKKKKLNKRNRVVPSNFQLRSLSHKSYSSFIRFLNKSIDKDNDPENAIDVPDKLSFVLNFEESLRFFENLHNVFYRSKDKIVINFKKCKHLSLGAATYLQVMLLEFVDFKRKYNASNYSQLDKDISINRSKTTKTNKMLYALAIIDSMDMDDDVESSSYLSMGLRTISKLRKNYKENIKGKTCTEVIHFVNESIRGSNYELGEKGINLMDNLMGEILGNAEDHSLLNEYYVNGVSFKEEDEESIVELNLTILNLGDSIYEGFIKTKEKNVNVYSLMEQLLDIHMKLLNGKEDKNYSKESLFTLYALQEGISRIKFEKESRGNGTMNFIRAFMDLGEFGEENPKYESRLNIISGHTVIECLNKYKPYPHGTVYRLSLNEEKDIKKLPDRKCIFVNKEYFPGTILQVKIFMSEKYFKKIVK